MKSTLFFLSYSFILMVQVNLNAQAIIRIPSDYPTIQEGLDKAKDSTVILVSPGIYYENIQWPLRKRAIQVIGTEGSEKTIIDGYNNGRVIQMYGAISGEADDFITHTTVIRGFTIQNGSLNHQFGAGLYSLKASPTLEDIHFTNNSCTGTFGSGAGAYLDRFSGEIINCHFTNNRVTNSSSGFGGGLYIRYVNSVSLINCTFTNNELSATVRGYGAGACLRTIPTDLKTDSTTLRIVGCQFRQNILRGEHSAQGAGLLIVGLDPAHVKMTIDSCIFSGNYPITDKESQGGGLYAGSLETTIRNSVFNENQSDQGAGIYFVNGSAGVVDIENTLVNDNKVFDETDINASAIYVDNSLDPCIFRCTNVVVANNHSAPLVFYEDNFEGYLLHCTFYNNSKNTFVTNKNFKNNAHVKAENSVFWNYPVKEFTQNFSSVVVEHCIVKGGHPGIGNINKEPDFLSESLLLPKPVSPCINNGKKLAYPLTDIQGFPRTMPSYSQPDIGAYETDQYLAHARVRFFYDHDKNGIKDQHDKYLRIGKVMDHKGQMHVNHSDSGLYIILEQGTAMIRYAEDVNDKWSPTSQATFIFNVDSDNFTKVIDIGLYPTKINTNVSTLVTSEHFRCGEEILFTLQVINDGTSIENGSFWLSVDDRINFISFVKNPDVVISSHRFAWSFNDLYPGESITIDFYVNAPEVSKPEDVGQIYYFCHGLQDNSPGNESCYEVALRCAYDPNDKIAMPHHSENLVLLGRPMYYTVRFQNTGNDFARHVVIRDTIDQSFDINSIKILHTSHPNNLNVLYNNNREVVFNFRDIILPDSLSDFQGSIGHVTYSIQHLPDIPQNTIVKNKANIHFDFNPPIITNTTKNIYTSTFPNDTNDESEYLIHVFPNPFKDYILFSQLADEVILLNVDGKQVGEAFNTDRISVNLPSGLYILILNVNGKRTTHKVILSDL